MLYALNSGISVSSLTNQPALFLIRVRDRTIYSIPFVFISTILDIIADFITAIVATIIINIIPSTLTTVIFNTIARIVVSTSVRIPSFSTIFVTPLRDRQ